MDKKQKERVILSLVYDEKDYDEVVDSEEPDFRIKPKDARTFFGVEVTELYATESAARLRNIPTYASELWDAKKYRHKDDKDILEVGPVTLNRPGRPSFTAITYSLPNIPTYINGLIKTVQSKEARLSKYGKDLSHVNLIVLDRADSLFIVPLAEFYRYVYTDEVKELLYRTGFREIFLVTWLKDTKWNFIPLKLVLLLSDFFKLKDIMLEHFPERFPRSNNDFMRLFTRYLGSKAENCRWRFAGKNIEVSLGGYGIVIRGKGIEVTEHFDQGLLAEGRSPDFPSAAAFFESEEFRAKERDYAKTRMFSSEFACELRAELTF